MEKSRAFRIPDFIQLSMLLIQTIYVILFFTDAWDFKNLMLLNYFEAAIVLLFATSLIAFIAYCIGFVRNTTQERILLAFLLLFHFGVAYSSFYLTVVTLISRC